MASSTTNPVEIVRAINEKLSKLKFKKYIIVKVPSKEIGTTTLGIKVELKFFKNKKTTIMTKTIAKIRVFSTSVTQNSFSRSNYRGWIYL